MTTSSPVPKCFPDVSELGVSAVLALWDRIEPLAQLEHEAVAAWATSVLSGLLEQYAKATAARLGRPIVLEQPLDRPPTPLSELSLAERAVVREHFTVDEDLLGGAADWCRRLVELVDVTAALERARFDVITAELRPEPSDADLEGLPPYPGA